MERNSDPRRNYLFEQSWAESLSTMESNQTSYCNFPSYGNETVGGLLPGMTYNIQTNFPDHRLGAFDDSAVLQRSALRSNPSCQGYNLPFEQPPIGTNPYSAFSSPNGVFPPPGFRLRSNPDNLAQFTQMFDETRNVFNPPAAEQPISQAELPATPTKPTYSDIAKHKPASHSSASNVLHSKNPFGTNTNTESGKPYLKQNYQDGRSAKTYPCKSGTAKPENWSENVESSGASEVSSQASEDVAGSRRSSFSSISSTQSGHTKDEHTGPSTPESAPENSWKCKNSVSKASVKVQTKSETTQTSIPKPVNDSKNTKSTPEDTFFDPRRIFKDLSAKSSSTPISSANVTVSKTKPTPLSTTSKTVKSKRAKPKVPVLNNQNNNSASGEPNYKAAHYINNNLHDFKKQTNVESKNYSKTETKPEKAKGVKERRKNDRLTKGTPSEENKEELKPTYPLGEVFMALYVWMEWAAPIVTSHLGKWSVEGGKFFGSLFLNILAVLIALLLEVLEMFQSWILKLWEWLTGLWGKERSKGKAGKQSDSRVTGGQFPGLREHITLPSTGEEAMKRLLGCKGKDPYSILGLRPDATDDDIKKYFRRQAVLVHPDKNSQPGAEESFKILNHAFNLIGEPENRLNYDTSQAQNMERDYAMQEFEDLLTKLHEKMKEAENTMRCEACQGTHKRYPTDRSRFNARYCDRCAVYHTARDGDVWAESKLLFYWNYYACMDGQVYNITDWAKCQHESFKSLQPNAHQVLLRISTTGQKNRSSKGPFSEFNGEPTFEDVLNSFLKKTNGPAGDKESSAAGVNPGKKRPRKKNRR